MTGFVLFGQSRTGSTLLVDLLDSHPEIACDGELLGMQLNNPYTPSRWVTRVVRRYPLPFFEWRRRRCGLSHYGFKLFVYHPKYPGFVLRQLVSRGWHIIHLVRNDVVATVLSSEIANCTRRWQRTVDDSQQPPSPVRIPVSLLRDSLEVRITLREQEETLLSPLPRLTVRYEEDLLSTAAQQATVDRICDALGIGRAPVTSGHLPTDARPLQERVSNHAEIASFAESAEVRQLLARLDFNPVRG